MKIEITKAMKIEITKADGRIDDKKTRK